MWKTLGFLDLSRHIQNQLPGSAGLKKIGSLENTRKTGQAAWLVLKPLCTGTFPKLFWYSPSTSQLFWLIVPPGFFCYVCRKAKGWYYQGKPFIHKASSISLSDLLVGLISTHFWDNFLLLSQYFPNAFLSLVLSNILPVLSWYLSQYFISPFQLFCKVLVL